MDQAKVIELLNQTILTDYLQKLLNVKLKKFIACPIFPITAAPNVSEPKVFLLIEDYKSFISLKKPQLN